MPVRAHPFPEVGHDGLNRAYAQHTRVLSGSDDGSETLSLGKRPVKRKKSDGLNTRLSRMLFRVNTSFVAEMPVPESKRPRKHSNGSSSSTVGPEIPQTPVDSIHASVKSTNVGEGFAIIKVGSSPDKGRSGYLSSKHLPSWRDADKLKEKEAERNRQRQDLPDWLSQIFSVLEPNHPLRALAPTKDPNSTYSDPPASPVPQEDSQTQKSHDETVFAFEPPQNSYTVAEGAPMTDTDQVYTNQPIATDTVHLIAGEEVESDLTNNNYNESHYMPADDDGAYQDPQTFTEEFQPFAQPGPFAQKNVHFLTPTRSSPMSLSHSTFVPSRSHSTASQSRTNNYATTYTPFATPGPTSYIPSTPPIHAYNPINNQSSSSDSLTAADDMRPEDDVFVFAHSVYEDDSAASALTFPSNSIDNNLDHNLNNPFPFSTPGPRFCAPPLGYFNSPTEDPSHSDPAEPAYDDIELELEMERMLSDGPQTKTDLESQKAMRFIAREHFEMVNGSRGTGAGTFNPNDTLTVEEPVQHAPTKTGPSLILDRLDDHRPFEPEIETNLPESEIDINPPARIELFSSPPYIRFAQTKSTENSNTGAHAVRSQHSTTKKRLPAAPSSPCMRLDHLPSPSPPVFSNINGAHPLPCTPPRSQLPRPEHSSGIDGGRESFVSVNIQTDDPTGTGERSATLNSKSQPKPRPRKRQSGLKSDQSLPFSPSRTANTEGHTVHAHDKDDNTQRVVSKPKAKVQNGDMMWNANASQLSEDSIQDWEP